MNLEDFFTLAELKDGLTSPDRVKELIIVLQRGKDHVFKNVSEASTQWDIFANIISITKSDDCLDLFIKLDGLLFINKWLKDAHKFGDVNGVHESTIALLRALDKLQINKIRLVCSGILKSVLELLVCDHSVIHEIAKALCDKWMLKEDGQTSSPVGLGDSGDKDEEVVDSSGGENCKRAGEGGSGMAEEVAMEVEREVDSKGGIESSGSRNGKESIIIGDSTKLASSEPGTVNDGETALGSVSKAAQESEANTEMFDLNQDGSSEETEGTPMDMVTTRTLSNSRKRPDRLNFDLNVAEESSMEVSPRKSMRLDLDLNSLGEGSVDDNVVLYQNGYRSPSQSSSTSIMQPFMRNVDLNKNDHSAFPNDAFPNRPNPSNNPTAISLFGTIVEKQPRVGRMAEPTLELGLGAGSSMGVYSFPSMYFPSPYGPIGGAPINPNPYMVDPRGGVGPQFVGSSSAVQPPPPAFLMNVGGGGGSEDNVDLEMNEGNGQVLDESYNGGQGWFSGDYKH